MPDYKKLCAELVEKLDELNCHYNVPNQSAMIERAHDALAEPEPEGPTDKGLLEAMKAGVASFPPRHPEASNLSAVEYELELELRKARAVLARWGNHPTPQPVPMNERWPEFSDCDRWERVWCWNWRVNNWKLSRIDEEIHSHWLPAHALLVPSHD